MGTTHKDLVAWSSAMDLVESIYSMTSKFPSAEKFGLISQLRRAAISVPSNVAEGAARASRREFSQFVSIARGSLSEVQTQVLIAERLGYCEVQEALHESINSLFSVLNGLLKKLAA